MPEVPIPHALGFARPLNAPPAVPNGWEDLRPWAWLRDEVLERFGPPIEQGDIWCPYEELKFQIHDAGGNRRQFWAIFSWSLFQCIEWA
jgi:hypothetical protein